MRKTTTPAPATRRLEFAATVSSSGWAYLAGQVADVPAALADELVQTQQAIETMAPPRWPVLAHCPRDPRHLPWVAYRVRADGQYVPRWNDDVDQSAHWTSCPACGAGYSR